MENQKGIRITYQTLFEMLRNEKTREELQKINHEYYNDIVNYLSEKYSILFSQRSSGDVFALAEKEKTQKEIINIRKLVKEIYDRRLKKMMIMALDKSRVPASIIDTSHLLKEENEIFNKILVILESNRKGILNRILEGKIPINEEPREVEEQKAETKRMHQPQEIPKKEEKKEDNKDSITTIRFTQPIPQFLGTELEKYGPFEQEDIASLPSKIADILIQKGSAEEVKGG